MNDSLFPLLLILRYMHILGAIALMGGTIFMRFALVPTVPELDEKSRAALHEGVRSRWAKFVMLSAALLLISGIANLGIAGARYNFDPPVGNMMYNILAGSKLILALPIFLFASLLTGRTEAAKKFQSNRAMWLNVNLALAVLLVLIGGFLRFVGRDLKSEKKGTNSQVVNTIE
jgi:uncharacterized membrane protein